MVGPGTCRPDTVGPNTLRWSLPGFDCPSPRPFEVKVWTEPVSAPPVCLAHEARRESGKLHLIGRPRLQWQSAQ